MSDALRVYALIDAGQALPVAVWQQQFALAKAGSDDLVADIARQIDAAAQLPHEYIYLTLLAPDDHDHDTRLSATQYGVLDFEVAAAYRDGLSLTMFAALGVDPATLTPEQIAARDPQQDMEDALQIALAQFLPGATVSVIGYGDANTARAQWRAWRVG